MKNKILTLLENSNNYISGEKLSNYLGVSRNSIWKHINKLKEEGYIIDAIKNKGYKLIKSPDIIDFSSVNKFLSTKTLGRKFYYFKEINSTNTVAKDLAKKETSHGTIITAEIQTNGTGRFKRNWHSPKGGIWASLILKPNLSPNYANKITLIAAASVFKTLKYLNIESKIKWPNDIYVNNKKLCGILTLMNCDMDTINYIIVGIGMNINITKDEFTGDLSNATSLLIEKGKKYNRGEILALFLNNFENFYDDFLENNNLLEVIDICRNNALFKNTKAKLITPREEKDVICLGIDNEGELIIKETNGQIKKVLSGELTFKI